jgi:hypothetical protein
MAPILLVTEPAPPQATESACPICGGPIRDLRGMGQCQRCQYICCQSCEGERPESVIAPNGQW